jgi:hypothetical protein
VSPLEVNHLEIQGNPEVQRRKSQTAKSAKNQRKFAKKACLLICSLLAHLDFDRSRLFRMMIQAMGYESRPIPVITAVISHTTRTQGDVQVKVFGNASANARNLAVGARTDQPPASDDAPGLACRTGATDWRRPELLFATIVAVHNDLLAFRF